MKHRELFEALKAGRIENVYLFYGPEEHIKASAVEQLQKAILPPGFELLNQVTLDNPQLQQIIECCDTLPVMSEWRCVLVKNFAPLASDGRAEKGGDEFAQAFLDYLGRVPKSTCLCFVGGESVDKRKKVSKALLALPGVVEFAQLSDDELIRWLAQRAKRGGKGMQREAAQQIAYLCGRDLTRLGGEVDKCVAYAEGETITVQDVDAAVTHSTEAQVFDVLNALFEGHYGQAVGQINVLLGAGESRLGILALLTVQVRRLLYIASMRKARKSPAEMGQVLGVSPYARQMMERRLKGRSEAQLRTWLQGCVSADYDIKRGEIREDAGLDRVLLMIAGLEA